MAYGMNALGFTSGANFGNMLYESEEERQKRLAREAGMVTAPAEPTPIKETRTIDPVTGEVKLKIEGSEQDLSAANPRTPTVVQPMAAEPAPAPIAAVAPTTAMPATAEVSAFQEPPALGTGLQVPPTARLGTEMIPDYQPEQRSQELQDWDMLLAGGQVNEKVRNRLITDPDTPAMYRRAAIASEREALMKNKEMDTAKEQANRIMQTGDTREFAREMKKEGSFLKALFFGALGANDIARNELDKLGYGTGKWQTVTDANGRTALVKFRTDDLPMEGFDQSGAALSTEDLARFGAQGGASNLDLVGGTYVNDTDGRVGTVARDKRTGQPFVISEGQRVPLGRGWRPQGVSGSLAQQYAADMQKAMIRFTTEPSIAAATELKTAAALADPGDFSVIRSTDQLIARLMPTSTPAAPAAPGAAPAAPPGVAPAAPPGAAPAAPPGVAGPGVTTTPAATAPVAPAAPTTTALPSAAPAVTAPVARPAGIAAGAPKQPGESFDAYTRRKAAEGDVRKAQLEVGTEQQKTFATKTIPAIGEEATGGREVSSLRRQQIDLINRNPTIVNIMNGDDSRYARARGVLRDIVTGAYNAENTGEFANAIRDLSLSGPEKAALQDYGNLNAQINPRTLKANTGGGQINAAEQKINKEANIQNIDRLEVYSVLSGLHRSQFQADMNAAKQSFLDRNANISTDRDWNTRWSRQQSTYQKAYEGILKARAEFIGRIPVPGPNASEDAKRAYRDRIYKAFEAYPAPRFDPVGESWNYGTANARTAAMNALAGGR